MLVDRRVPSVGWRIREPGSRFVCVFGEEAQSGISRMRQPAEGTRSKCPFGEPAQCDYLSEY